MFQRIDTLGKERTQDEATDTAYSEKSQRLGRQVVAGLYMLLRSSKLYEPSNAIFVKPVAQLVDLLNQIHSRDGKLLLQFTPDSIYLNDSLLRLDASSYENQRELALELRTKKVFGIGLSRPATTGDVLTLLRRLGREQPSGEQARPEDAAFQLMSNDLAEKLRSQAAVMSTEAAPSAIDRKKYLLTVYARAIFFLRSFLGAKGSAQPIAGLKAMPLVQQIVDLCVGAKSQFIGLTSLEDVQDYPLFHAVNTTLLAVVFGSELGLSKAQLRDLGYAALFHDVGRAQLPRALTDRNRALTPEQRERVARARFDSVRAVIAEGAMTRANVLRIAVGFEHQEPYGTVVRDRDGKVQMTVSRGRLLLYSRMVAICSVYDALTSKRPFREAYGPDVALMMMWTEMQARFDPRLLESFVRLMGPQQLEILSGDKQHFSLL